MGERRPFRDRRDAGRVLVGLLEHHRDGKDVVVLGLPRGGLPVAYEVAMGLGAALDVFLVRKLGVPGRTELAMGAIATGASDEAIVIMNDDLIRRLRLAPDVIDEVVERERRELHRRDDAYRRGRRPLPLGGRTVIIVDDGLATGASMRAAIVALRPQRPDRIVAAVPVAPSSTWRELRSEVDDIVCATTPSPFVAVGASYRDFRQTTDQEVRDLLDAADPAGHLPP